MSTAAHPALPKVAHAFRAGQSLWVAGPLASGRSQLVGDLLKAEPDAVCVDLVALTELDSFVASLLPPAAGAGASEAVGERLNSPEEAATALVQALRASSKPTLIRLRSSWTSDPSSEDEADSPGAAMRERHARGVLRQLAQVPRAVWISDARIEPTEVGAKVDRRFDLPPLLCSLAEVEFRTLEGLDAPIDRLRKAAGPRARACPLVWRVAVGAIKLDANPDWVADVCASRTGAALNALAKEILHLSRQKEPLTRLLGRIAQVRQPVPATELLAALEVEAQHASLVTDCLGYGEPVRVHPVLRQRFETIPASTVAGEAKHLEGVHRRLAAHFQSQDGVLSPRDLATAGRALAWVEKVHHLGRGGEESAKEWARHDLVSPEQYWDRARQLSIQGAYRSAAAVYEAAVDRFAPQQSTSKDFLAYLNHYLAFNLERGGEAGATVRKHYATAAEKLDPSNPWWNSRFVCYLIKHGSVSSAQDAWRDALTRVDPDVDVAQQPWIAAHFYYWVAEAWLDKGSWFDAAEVLRMIPKKVQDLVGRRYYARSFKGLRERVIRQRDDERIQLEAWFGERTHEKRWEVAAQCWRDVLSSAPGAPTPAALDTQEGNSQLAWSLGDYYLEIEATGTGELEWFAQDRRSRREDGGEADVESGLPAEFIGWVRKFSLLDDDE